MKILIISGFLGSGKTSVVIPLARYIVEHSSSDSEYKVAILENEIGEIGVDDKTLRVGGYQVESIFSGCACCTMAGEVPVAVKRIRDDLSPEWLIMELTGLAYPLKIKNNLHDALGLESRICTVTDAKRWKRLFTPMRNLLSGQLSDADTILINKKDLVDEDTLKEVIDSVGSLNASADIIPVSARNGLDEDICRSVFGL